MSEQKPNFRSVPVEVVGADPAGTNPPPANGTIVGLSTVTWKDIGKSPLLWVGVGIALTLLVQYQFAKAKK